MTPSDTAPPAGIQDAARHLAEGRAAEAVTLLERLARAFPLYVTAHVLLAKAYEASDRPDAALAAWHDAYFLMPGSPLVRRERARLLKADAAFATPKPSATNETVEAAAPTADPEAQEMPGGDAAAVAEPETESEAEQPEAAPPPPPEAEHADAAEPEAARETAWDEAEEEAGAPASEPAPGAESSAWQAAAPPPGVPTGVFDDDEETADWKIVEETETPRSDADEPVEPIIAPPPGHPRAPRSPSHDTSASGRFVEDDFGEEAGEADDLDTLIEQLERAPRIRPDPEFHGDEAEPDAFGAGEVVSETLARIYETQKQFADAARAYEQLAAQRPGRADELSAKADEMRRRAAEAGQV